MELKIYVDEIRNNLANDFKYIDERLIIQTINEYREILLKEQFNQGRSIDDIVSQTINIDLQMIDAIEYPIRTSTHKILRSTKKIPKTINRHFQDSIISVRSGLTINEKYNYVTKEQAIYAGNGYTNKKKVFVFLFNDYIYVKLNKNNSKINLLKNLVVEGVFEDPREAYLFNDNTKDELKMDYPIPMAIWTRAKDMVIDRLQRAIQTDIAE